MTQYNMKLPKRMGILSVSFVIVIYLIVQSLFLSRMCSTTSDGDLLDSVIELESEKQRANTGDIMFAVSLTKRIGYSRFTASVVRRYHEIPDVDIYVFPQNKNTYTYGLLNTWYGNEITILPEQLSQMRHILEIFTDSSYEILFLVDSEMIFMSNWREFLVKHVQKNNRQFLSLYHSATLHSSQKDCDIKTDEVCEGAVSGKFGIAFNRKFAKILLSRNRELVDRLEWNQILKKENITGIFPAKSLAIKIGQRNQDGEYCGENEVPYGFRLCDFPNWISDGIEFYFDRCTDPQERYSSDLSQMHSIANRTWVRPALIYSFYGNKSRYVNGALDNVKRVFTIYPGWKVWVYVDNTVDLEIANELCSYNVKFVNMTGRSIGNRMSWRFLITTEPVKYFTILDVDYRMLERGRLATEEWLKSGRKFHVMRDHPNHSKVPINGHMWGGYGNSIPNMRQLIADYKGNDEYMVDINFLTANVWPIIKKSAWVHNAYSMHIFGEDHPFPTKREKNNGFVGDVNYA